ncbi:hypothetical protein R1T16_09085 [Flavobacterium sp. DG1-102-2]|uniref:hypothetical protein n=1 Tax=Flavobacterium sp. DG1-102-2 TaxID=3081663 RepID=UPI0029495EF3|nr:hypothetical protein [Flavobacterium sp. DG1-102-2]MDV6168576.1 hypothetical protein [Flavobacterium sp. DG1-102-2]
MTRQILETLTASRHIYNELMASSKLNGNLREKARATYENEFNRGMNIIIDLVNVCLKKNAFPPVNSPDDAIQLILTEDSLIEKISFISNYNEPIGSDIEITGQQQLQEAVNHLSEAKKSMVGYHGLAKMTGQV